MDINDGLCVGDLIFSLDGNDKINNEIMFVFFGSHRVLVYLYEKKRLFWRDINWVKALKLNLAVQKFSKRTTEWENSLSEFMAWHDYDVRAGFLYLTHYKSGNGPFVTEFPQLIPHLEKISFDEYKTRFATLLGNASMGDMLFTSNPRGIISTTIRKLTHGPWSHCGLIHNNFTVADMNITGLLQLPIEHYFQKRFRMGLYRYVNGLTIEQQIKMGVNVQRQLIDSKKYHFSYLHAIKTGLANWRGYQYQDRISPMDIIYGGNMKIISYV